MTTKKSNCAGQEKQYYDHKHKQKYFHFQSRFGDVFSRHMAMATISPKQSPSTPKPTVQGPLSIEHPADSEI